MRLVRLAPLVLLLASCASQKGADAPTPPKKTGTQTASTAAAPPPPAPVPAVPTVDPKVSRVHVFAVSDFHGHLAPLEPRNYDKYFGGIANLSGTMKHKDSFHAANSILLDNGDMWTGPSVSTFLRGEPVIAAYNSMGLTAANVANHEFDFGQEVLKARIGEAKFPFLGANIKKTGTDEAPSFVKPWIVVEKDGMKIGIIGLSYEGTPQTTLATHVAGLEFRPYAETLKTAVPAVRKAGAEAVVVLFHDTIDRVKEVLEKNPGLGISAVVAGQDHRKGRTDVDGTIVVNPGPFGRSYVRFDIEMDRASKKITKVSPEIVDITGKTGAPEFPPDQALLAIAEGARQKSKSLSSKVLGKVSGPLPVGSFADSPLGHLIVDAWLAAFPKADAAICNHGAIRQPLGAGPITMDALTSVLPFENNLYIVEISGKQLLQQLAIDSPVVSGLTWLYSEKGGKRKVISAKDRNGRKIKPRGKYKIVINDFMYFGGDGYSFKDLDSTPDDTGLSIREPVMRMLRLANSAGREVDPPVGPRAAERRARKK